MKKSEVLAYYGTSVAAAKALRITHSAISQWNDELIPERMAWRLQFLTGGALSINPRDYGAPTRETGRRRAGA